MWRFRKLNRISLLKDKCMTLPIRDNKLESRGANWSTNNVAVVADTMASYGAVTSRIQLTTPFVALFKNKMPHEFVVRAIFVSSVRKRRKGTEDVNDTLSIILALRAHFRKTT